MILKRSLTTALLLAVTGFSLPISAAGAVKTTRVVANLAEIETTIEKAMQTFDVPGLAVAIVKDDKVVMSKGFGLLELGKKGKVNADTLFGIASNTKAFTTAALAMLADEGKLDWDDKVTDYLPSFQLYDAYVTRQFTLRDMLSHRSGLGLGAGDLMIWPSTTIDSREIIKRMRFLKPVSSFRSEYAYNNLMYVLAGQIVAKVSGMSWESFVRERILIPLKMKNTRMKASLVEAGNHNVATPHSPVNGVLQPHSGNFLQSFLSAGSMASSVNDMSLWLRMQLKNGLIATLDSKEKRLFSKLQSEQMWSANTLQPVRPVDAEMDRTHFKAYGLGWGLKDYHGYKMVGHSGGILGMVSRVVMIPEINLGVVVLTNQQSGPAFRAIVHDIVNRHIGLENRDWVAIHDAQQHKRVITGHNYVATLMQNRNADSAPSLPLAYYAQVYQDDWYGDIEIAAVDGGNKLEMRFSRSGVLVGELEHFQYNTFIVRWYDRSINADAFVNFQLTSRGYVSHATMEAISPLTDFSFDFHDLRLKPKHH